MFIIILLITILLIRLVEFYLFMKRINKLCHKYDWSYVEHNEELLLNMINDKEYYTYSDWSAYSFLYLNGPSPLNMFFSFKPLTIESQYNDYVIEKIKKYEIK